MLLIIGKNSIFIGEYNSMHFVSYCYSMFYFQTPPTVMKKILLLSLLFPVFATGQFFDNFNDGDFLTNPQWYGDVNKFGVNDELLLQLVDDAAGSSFLYIPTQQIDSSEWHFRIKLSFSPSANNNARIYLGATNDDPNSDGDAFFLQLGESGSDDALELHRVSASNDIVICRGTNGLISSSFDMMIKITRSVVGKWRIFVDPSNSGSYQLDAEGVDNTSVAINYFIVQCNYTKSNSTKFYFDDVYHGNIIADITKPYVDRIKVVSQNALEVYFSENIDEESASEITNYLVNKEIGNPFQAIVDNEDKCKVYLYFGDSFENSINYSLNIHGVMDLNNNIMEEVNIDFVYLESVFPSVGDIVINEIMCDVNPKPENLPAYDFVELYNCSNNLISLSGCILSFGSHTYTFPETSEIYPNDFLLISDNNSGYDSYGNTLFFSQFPVNNETMMILKNSNGELLHFVDYKKEWYHDADKEDGGWSLEMRDCNNPFGDEGNWSASQHDDGGTPAHTNSVVALYPDKEPPYVKHVAIEDEHSIRVFFSESMDSASIFQNVCLEVEEFGYPDSVIINFPYHNTILLCDEDYFFTNNEVYHLKVKSLAHDYAGNIINADTIPFARHCFEYGDIVINEIMCDVNPAPHNLPAAEYIELYNKTIFPADLSQYVLYVGSKEITFPIGTSVKPHEYLLITENEKINNDDEVFVGNIGLTNSGTSIQLMNAEDYMIHYVSYNDSWYNDEIKSEGGWSLEMIDIENPCGEDDNWTASDSEAGGTPLTENSVKEINTDNIEPDFYRVIVPDSNTVLCVFNEQLNSKSILETDIFVNPGSIIPVSKEVLFPENKIVKLVFANPLKSNKEYSVNISNSLTDCVGNKFTANEIPFMIPELPDSNDVIINEILFNAPNDCYDFIEIYNRSIKAVDLSGIIIDYVDEFSLESINRARITTQKYILMPKEYLVVSRDYSTLEKYYHVNDKKALFNTEDMPNLGAISGVVQITNLNGEVIDRVIFSDELHYPLLNNTKGVSLERISSETSSAEKKNWHSAAEDAGFATPGYENSQMINRDSAGDNFVLDKKIFSPDNDGSDDILVIDYNMKQSGYTANIKIFDSNGYGIKSLENNLFLGISGKIFWDGINDNGDKVSIGYYIVYFEIYNPQGDVEQFKKTVVVTGKM